ncbi:aspartate/glutamate racemase family protein [Roseibacterium sp. SDUM158016]|jgi:allantoin racemase|uniref:aspartate/glutamate racemase family protein n=1 Tax=Roseicyclus sediminis TaxID=2980997 RepID=UPI0021D08E94|nr:aspartate/glutamate racemase family protein [Roseibacterium sp. SDUM158016]MCU4653003.1 aspartate/glutamate racemase family protein [Roseibacterium sp. SDUM158016]
MRLLIVNPNTSAGVTARIDAAAQAVAQPGDRFTTVSAASGPALIVTEADAEAATAGVLQAIERHDGPIDGIVLASFGDTGAEEVRMRHPRLPVLGIAEAAFGEVRRIGGPFAIVTFAPEVAGPLSEKAAEHGVADLLIRVASPAVPLAHDPADVADAMLHVLLDLCRGCVSDGARSVVLGGGPLAGVADRIASACPVRVVDGTQAAIGQLRERLVTG